MNNVVGIRQNTVISQPEVAWLFDIDGVLTDPQEKRIVLPQIFEELIKILKRGEPVGLNTGRSFEFMVTEVLEPFEEKIEDKRMLENIFAAGEKGALWIVYGKDGERVMKIDEEISVPKEIQKMVRELVGKEKYSDIVFYDEAKKSMVSIELKKGRTIEEFRNYQSELKSDLQDILERFSWENKYRVDSTRIAFDIESLKVGKALGVRKLVELFNEKGIYPREYISFGDSSSDYEMFEELSRMGEKVEFVFVGEPESLVGKDTKKVTFTKQFFDKGTLEYLQRR